MDEYGRGLFKKDYKDFISMKHTERKDLCTSSELGHWNAFLCLS